ncbi:hypothetical protein HPB48_016535 [Haemaphysalis longicornis]|uniref:ATP synthase F1 subunit epsilon n=1 Tax=Haemaphysalis longicornis TaxID=44386 RepID=A0A9J6GBW3_HAELO|nr:hypothetical protein HPB48_016535 [Haemaphysalis longicornis]
MVFFTFQGGGTGGSIRDAGGTFGKMEAAREEEYFRKLVSYPSVLQAQQVEMLKNHIEDEIASHEKLIKQHQEEIDRHKKKIQKLKEH